MDDIILSVRNISKTYDKKKFKKKESDNIPSVNNVSFDIIRGKTFSLVGESGSGKSTLGKIITRLTEENEGTLYFNNQNIKDMNRKELKNYHIKVQMIFQNPYSSINPCVKIKDIIGEGVTYHKLAKNNLQLKDIVVNNLEEVGLSSECLERYPHEFSGGQIQRIGIARALALNPELIIADEILSALDMYTQSKILTLLLKLQKKRKLSYLFISHDLSVVKKISNVIGVMYNGKIIEINNSNEIFLNPKENYTKELLNAIPRLPFEIS